MRAGFRDGGDVGEALAAMLTSQLKHCEVRAAVCESRFVMEALAIGTMAHLQQALCIMCTVLCSGSEDGILAIVEAVTVTTCCLLGHCSFDGAATLWNFHPLFDQSRGKLRVHWCPCCY
jgi:hypothetical protein